VANRGATGGSDLSLKTDFHQAADDPGDISSGSYTSVARFLLQ